MRSHVLISRPHVTLRLRAMVLAATLLALPLHAMARSAPDSFSPLVERLMPAVVNISTTQKISPSELSGQMLPFQDIPQGPGMEEFKEFFERFGGGGKSAPQEVQSLGSGFIIDPAGYVVTNNHVITKAEDITVILSDNTKLKATVVGKDPKTDLALLKVDSKTPLPFVSFGNSDNSKVGDWVIAIGNPFGLGGSVSAGIISARQRNINAGPFDDFIQTDAAINRGNSGGPMFNMDGEVIGINSAIFSPSGGNIGIGFAVPSSLAQPVLKQLRELGKTQRGWLGVKIQEVTDEMAESMGLGKARGALVIEVSPDSPAGKAGIKLGDVITRFDGRDVKEMRQLPRIVAETKIGKEVDVDVFREGKTHSFDITVAELEETDEEMAEDAPADKPKGAGKTEKLLGMELTALNAELRQQYGLDAGTKGLLVITVDEGSEAAKQDVREGDIIHQIGSTPITDLDEAADALSAVRNAGRKNALIRLEREGEPVFITLPTEEKKK